MRADPPPSPDKHALTTIHPTATTGGVMGQYIQIGVCQQVQVATDALARTGVTVADVQSAIGADLDLSLFDLHESPEALVWTLKEPLLRDGLVPFVTRQLQLVKPALDDEYLEFLPTLAACRDTPEILSRVQTDGSWMLRLYQHREELDLPWRRRGVYAHFSLLVYLTEGKALLECYNDLFRYMQRTITFQKAEFPLAAAVKVCIG